MKVLLRSDIPGVGRRGDLIEVSGGYARNYLLPGGLAVEANDGIATQAAAMRRSRDLRDAADREAAQAKAVVLAGAVIGITARAGGNGRLFGSITAHEIVNAIETQKGVRIERHHLFLDEAIKATGSHELKVVLFDDVETTITVEVIGAA
jgi:large subunit ribosomal protein L9